MRWRLLVFSATIVAATGCQDMEEAISAGASHTCGLTKAGAAYCWGENRLGQLGDGTTTQHLTPTAVLGGHTFGQISTEWLHTCGLTTAGEAYCWGSNYNGELGDGTTTNRTVPTAVTGVDARRLPEFRQISAGNVHTCAVATSGAAYCWGSNYSSQLGDSTIPTIPSLPPTAVPGGYVFRQISAGDEHTCGLTSAGAVYCWGNNHVGQLGDGTRTKRLTPTAVVGGHTFQQISAGTMLTCGLTTAGEAYCWGFVYLLRGDTPANRLTPTAVLGGHKFRQITVGGYYTCGITTAGAAHCLTPLGSARVDPVLTPTAVPGGHVFRQISVGPGHACGITTEGAAYCWGSNYSGKLGDGTTTNRTIPTAVPGGLTF